MNAIFKLVDKKSKGFEIVSIEAVVLFFLSLYGFTFYGQQNGAYTQIVPGGGGVTSGILISPHDSNLMLSATDMGATFRSSNAGDSWTGILPSQLKYLNLASPRAWAWSLTDPNVILAGTHFGFYKSSDKGLSWSPMSGSWTNTTFSRTWSKGPEAVVFSSIEPHMQIAAFNNFQDSNTRKVMLTFDDGLDWVPLTTYNESAKIIDVFFDESAGKGKFGIVNENGIYYFSDWGATLSFQSKVTNEATEKIVGYAEVNIPAKGKVCYATVATRDVGNGKINQPIYKSTDAGKTWTATASTGLQMTIENGAIPRYERLSISRQNLNTVYATYEGGSYGGSATTANGGDGGVFCSADGGTNWKEILFTQKDHPNKNANANWMLNDEWQWAQIPEAIATDPTNIDKVYTSQNGLYRSTDKGGSWQFLSANALGTTNSTVGSNEKIPVLSIWDFHMNIGNYKYRYLASTDFTFFSSEDWGYSWKKSKLNFNNIFTIVSDPVLPASGIPRVWIGGGWRHDIPFWNNLAAAPGGIDYSNDNFNTVRETQAVNGLPDAVCTNLYLDPSSPVNNRTLWAAMLDRGIYVSYDDGVHWTEKNNGISQWNRNAYKVGKTPDGRLFALVTIRPAGLAQAEGQLYLSDDNGNSWQSKIPATAGIPYPVNVQFHPTNKQIFYIAANQSPLTPNLKGGIWKTTDGGTSWTLLIEGNANDINIHPNNPNSLIVTISQVGESSISGVYETWDEGKNWYQWENYPAPVPFKIVRDPFYPEIKFITNFGYGILKTNASRLGIETNSVYLASSIKIFPNPAKDLFNIKGLTQGDKITITDMLGKIVLNTVAKQEEEIIATAGFGAGMYIVSVGENTRLKLVKE